MIEQQTQQAGTAPAPEAGTSELTAFDPQHPSNQQGNTGTSDTPNQQQTEAETDEQRNARAAEAAQRRSEKRRESLNARINELTAERYAEKARADAAERRADELLRNFTQRGSAPAPSGSGEPRREQFSDYESYLEARAEWRAATAFQRMAREASARGEQVSQAQAAEAQLGEMQRNIKSSVSDFVKSHPDYHDVIESTEANIPVAATLAIGTHKDAAAIMYHLGQNHELAESLATMSPMQQIFTIGEIAARVRSSSPQVSKAPPPGQPVGSKVGSADSPPEDTAAYMAWAEKHMR